MTVTILRPISVDDISGWPHILHLHGVSSFTPCLHHVYTVKRNLHASTEFTHAKFTRLLHESRSTPINGTGTSISACGSHASFIAERTSRLAAMESPQRQRKKLSSLPRQHMYAKGISNASQRKPIDMFRLIGQGRMNESSHPSLNPY